MHTGHLRRQGALSAKIPYPQAIWFQGKRRLERKDIAFQGPPLHHQISLRCRTISTFWLGSFDPIPFQETRPGLRVWSFPVSWDRLTHVQLLFTWNPSPLQSSKFPFEYLLLPPRSAPCAVPPKLEPRDSQQAHTPSYSLVPHSCSNGQVSVTRLSAIHFRG